MADPKPSLCARFRRTSRLMVLQCRPSTRVIAAGRKPCCRRRPSVYLSAKVIWRYCIAGLLFLPEMEALGYRRVTFLVGDRVALTL